MFVSGTIKNGIIQSGAAGLSGSANFGGGTLDGVALQGTLDMSGTQEYLTIVNGISLSGSGGTGKATINLTGAASVVQVNGVTTLDNATINIGSSAGAPASLFAQDKFNKGTVVTLGPNLVVQQTGAHALLDSATFSTDGFINQGIINAGINGGTLTLMSQVFGSAGQFTMPARSTRATATPSPSAPRPSPIWPPA